jgi:FkbM family methyltransferase
LAAATFVALRRLPGRKLRAFAYANVSRPLATRMTSEVIVPVHGGFRMRVDMADVVGTVLATSGVWEPYVVAAIELELGRDDVCVDVGAHVGFHALVASGIVGPEGHVYALEPTAATFRQLCANLELNAISNVTALAVAAGESEGTGVMVDAEVDNTGTSAIRRVAPGEAGRTEADSVAVRPLASLIDPSHVSRLRLVKIDVEGYEAEVLRGLGPLLEAGARPSLIVELHSQGVEGAADELGRMSKSYGLVAYEIVRHSRRDRFAPPPPPREIARIEEMIALARKRPVNVLLTRSGRPGVA